MKVIAFIWLLVISANLAALEFDIQGEAGMCKEKQCELWFGWVEASRAYTGEYNETVIEFYCHKFHLHDGSQVSKDNVIYVYPDSEGDTHFVATIRTPDLPVEKAQEFLKSMQTTVHFCHYPKAITVFNGLFYDKHAQFLTGNLIVSDKYVVVEKE